ncbi:MAG: hypothetical protein ACOH2E_02890 [Candidatus Paracaedibacter sp.]
MVIKQILVVSLLFISIPAMASIPCPTCKKGYVASSLEEVLIAQQEVKKSVLKKISFDKPFSEGKTGKTLSAKSPAELIMSRDHRNNRNAHAQPAQKASRSLSPKRDQILEITGAPFRSLYGGTSDFPDTPTKHNLRGTFDKNLAINTQQQLRQQIRNLKK